MALTDRIITVKFSLAGKTVVVDESINIKIRAQKAALAIQNRCTIEIIGLTTALREALLSQFTAWDNRKVQTGRQEQKWVGVEVTAGYKAPSRRLPGQQVAQPSVIFKGEVTLCELISTPPDTGVRLTCFTRQIDKTKWTTTDRAPVNVPFNKYVEWAAGQMGFGSNFICKTDYDSKIQPNPAQSISIVSALLIDIQNLYRPDVAAFIDDGMLIVKNKNAILNPEQTVKIDQFVGIPSWDEWGVSFVCLFNPAIRLAQGVDLKSSMNPSVNQRYVVVELEYELASRDNQFYVKVGASPAA